MDETDNVITIDDSFGVLFWADYSDQTWYGFGLLMPFAQTFDKQTVASISASLFFFLPGGFHELDIFSPLMIIKKKPSVLFYLYILSGRQLQDYSSSSLLLLVHSTLMIIPAILSTYAYIYIYIYCIARPFQAGSREPFSPQSLEKCMLTR